MAHSAAAKAMAQVESIGTVTLEVEGGCAQGTMSLWGGCGALMTTGPAAAAVTAAQ